jgi:hypothetical protein
MEDSQSEDSDGGTGSESGDSDSDSDGVDGIDPRRRELLAQRWKDGKEAYAAVQQYCFVIGKSCKLGTKSGTYKTAVCATNGCTFQISVAKREAKKDNTWHIVEKSAKWEHRNCTSYAKPSAKLLASMASVRTAVEGNRAVAAKPLGTIVQVHWHHPASGQRGLLNY